MVTFFWTNRHLVTRVIQPNNQVLIKIKWSQMDICEILHFFQLNCTLLGCPKITFNV